MFTFCSKACIGDGTLLSIYVGVQQAAAAAARRGDAAGARRDCGRWVGLSHWMLACHFNKITVGIKTHYLFLHSLSVWQIGIFYDVI